MMESIWITWDDHRRSRELAEHWGMDYKVFEYSGNAFIRYILLSIKTLKYINQNKPDIVICQNPSIVLAAILTIFRKIKKFVLVVDRHSNFKIELRESPLLKWKLFHILSDYSLRRSNLTIVTNSEAEKYVKSLGGKPAILPDKLPSDLSSSIKNLEGEVNFLFICTFSNDEPVDAVLNAFKRLNKKYHIYVTGNFRKYKNWNKYCEDENIHLLGFVKEEDYLSYLNSVDATIVLTNMPMTLNCGSYESVRAGKPQIVADSSVIKEWFRKGAIYVNPNDENSIHDGINRTIEKLNELTIEQKEFSELLESDWRALDHIFRKKLYQISGYNL